MTPIVPCRPVHETDTYALLAEVKVREKTIPAGFQWDGASIPRLLWDNLGYGPFHPRVMLASLYHDAGYRRDDPNQEHEDRTFHELLLECGVPRWRARLMYCAVRWYRKPPEPSEPMELHSER